jgi:hypothetical protein
VHILVEGFDVFGVHIQYWMLAALTMVVGATIVGIRGSTKW